MRPLSSICHVQDSIGLFLSGSLGDGSQVRGAVHVAAVRLLHDQGHGRAVLVLVPFQKHALGALALHRQPLLAQVADHPGQARVVEGLPPLRHGHAQQVVQRLELRPGHRAQRAPRLHVLLVASLQLNNLLSASSLELIVFIKPGFGLLVKHHQVPDVGRLRVRQRLRLHLLKVGNEHAELRAPVAHVVQPQHLVAAELQHPGQGVPDDGGAQVAHVHLLGDVRAAEVHHRPPRPRCLSNAESIRVHRHAFYPLADIFWLQLEVNESWSCNFWFFTESRSLKFFN
mmetsp:Transcript_49063/g.71666  ORF Transcript_49063/g.71666 Transcript_49063/m.71666 type:complete len:285 (+) Transcript_49063:917-1771(+)